MSFITYVTCPSCALLLVMRSVFVVLLVEHSQEAVDQYEQSLNQAPNEFAVVISQLQWRNKKRMCGNWWSRAVATQAVELCMLVRLRVELTFL